MKKKSEEESVVDCLFERKLQFTFRSATQFLNWPPVFFIGATKLLAVHLGWARQGRPLDEMYNHVYTQKMD